MVWWLAYAFCVAVFDRKKCDAIYVCDGLLAPLGAVLKKITKKPVFITCHGLDVTYSLWIYRAIVIPALKKLDKIICVSRATLEECAKRGIGRERLVFIPNGVDINRKSEIPASPAGGLNLKSALSPDKNYTLLTIGRLVKRKGVAWFIENVMTNLPKNYQYLIVGAGPEHANIENLISEKKLGDRVFLLGRISNQELEEVYAKSSIFVMPNISVPGDIEGFGLVALEAVMHNLPVIAADLEGIRDAIHPDENGILVSSANAREFIRQINILSLDSEKKDAFVVRAREFTAANFNWEKIGKNYLYEIQKISR